MPTTDDVPTPPQPAAVDGARPRGLFTTARILIVGIAVLTIVGFFSSQHLGNVFSSAFFVDHTVVPASAKIGILTAATAAGNNRQLMTDSESSRGSSPSRIPITLLLNSSTVPQASSSSPSSPLPPPPQPVANVAESLENVPTAPEPVVGFASPDSAPFKLVQRAHYYRGNSSLESKVSGSFVDGDDDGDDDEDDDTVQMLKYSALREPGELDCLEQVRWRKRNESLWTDVMRAKKWPGFECPPDKLNSILKWEMEFPERCPFVDLRDEANVDLFVAATANKSICIVGDSLVRQFFFTFTSILSKQFKSFSSNAWYQYTKLSGEGTSRPGMIDALYHHGLRVRTVFLARYGPTPIICNTSDTEGYNRLWNWCSPDDDVIITNLAVLHMPSDGSCDSFPYEYLKRIRARLLPDRPLIVLGAATRHETTTNCGHIDDATEVDTLDYGHTNVVHGLEVLKKDACKRLNLEYVDIERMSIPRPDAHSKDCIHYCGAGLPVDWLSLWVSQFYRVSPSKS